MAWWWSPNSAGWTRPISPWSRRWLNQSMYSAPAGARDQAGGPPGRDPGRDDAADCHETSRAPRLLHPNTESSWQVFTTERSGNQTLVREGRHHRAAVEPRVVDSGRRPVLPRLPRPRGADRPPSGQPYLGRPRKDGGRRRTRPRNVDLLGQCIADLLWLVIRGQVDQHRVTGLAFDQSPDRGLVLFADVKSPSQLPGTARSSSSGGRSAMFIMLGMRFLRCPAQCRLAYSCTSRGWPSTRSYERSPVFGHTSSS